MKILYSSSRSSRPLVPWWVIVGAIGFLIFGGWRGFFGAIAGVILIPVILLTLLALGFFVWSIYLTKKLGKNYKPRSPFEFENKAQSPSGQSPNETVTIEAEAKTIRVEED